MKRRLKVAIEGREVRLTFVQENSVQAMQLDADILSAIDSGELHIDLDNIVVVEDARA